MHFSKMNSIKTSLRIFVFSAFDGYPEITIFELTQIKIDLNQTLGLLKKNKIM